MGVVWGEHSVAQQTALCSISPDRVHDFKQGQHGMAMQDWDRDWVEGWRRSIPCFSDVLHGVHSAICWRSH
jgi:hypothetical protein